MTGLGKTISWCVALGLLAACSFTIENASETTPEPALGMETALAIAASTAEIPRPTPTSAAAGTIENPLVVALPQAAHQMERLCRPVNPLQNSFPK